MWRRVSLAILPLVAIAGIFISAGPSASAAVDLTGRWHYTIVVGNFNITAECDASFLQTGNSVDGTFDCGEDGTGTLSGTLTDATQGATVDADLTLHTGGLDIEAHAVGTVSADSNAMNGTWHSEAFGGVDGTFDGQRSPFPKGDLNCDHAVDAVDALAAFTYLAGPAPIQDSECQHIGSGVVLIFGDMDCDAYITPGDGLDILRYTGELSVPLPSNCAPIGQ